MTIFLLGLGVGLIAYGVYIFKKSYTEDGRVMGSLAIVVGIVIASFQFIDILHWIYN